MSWCRKRTRAPLSGDVCTTNIMKSRNRLNDGDNRERRR